MNPAEFLTLLQQTGAVQSGHFSLSSGQHSSGYIQCALLLQHPTLAARACGDLAERFRRHSPGAVIGPAYGGIIVAHEVARALGTRALFAERVDGKFALRRSLRLDPGERVLIAEDVITTGASTLEVADLVTRLEGQVVGLAALVDRRAEQGALPWPCEALLRLTVPIYDPATCPLCAQGVPVTKPGSRHLHITVR